MSEKIVFHPFDCKKEDLPLKFHVLQSCSGLPAKDLKIDDERQYAAYAAKQILREKTKTDGPAMALRVGYRDPMRGQQRLVWLVGAKFGSRFGDTGGGI